jgi:hypothetical protein
MQMQSDAMTHETYRIPSVRERLRVQYVITYGMRFEGLMMLRRLMCRLDGLQQLTVRA